MEPWSFYLLLSVSVFNFPRLSSSYIYQEVDGSFDNGTELSFDIFLKRSSGTILYAIDSNKNRIILQVRTGTTGPELFFNIINKMKMNDACGCSTCFDTLLRFSFQFQDLVTIKCNNKSQLFSPFYTKGTEDHLRSYPIYNIINTNKKKISIWMGNTGPYVGQNGIMYFPNKQQLIGCLERFFFNHQSIIFTNYINSSATPCDEDYAETICNKDYCTNRTIPVVIKPFSIQFFRCEYCGKVSPYNLSRNQSFVVNESNKHVKPITLKWKHSNSSGYCLVEMKLKDESLIIMHIDRYNQLIVSVINITSRSIQSRTFETLLTNTNNYVTINFDAPDSVIEIRNYKFAQSIPKLINVGFSQLTNLCNSTRDKIDFQFDSNQMKSLEKLANENKDKNNDFMSNYVVIAIIVALISVFVGLLILFYWRIKKEINSDNTQVAVTNVTPKLYEERKHSPIMGQLQGSFEAVNESCIYRVISD